MKNEFIPVFILLLLIIPITIIDIKTKRIPDLLTYSGIALIFLIELIINKQSFYSLYVLLFTGFVPFFLIWYFTKGKMGLGDAKLSALLALTLGIRGWLLMLFISSSAAVLFAVIMLVLRKIDKKAKIPYAPFLSFGALLSIFII